MPMSEETLQGTQGHVAGFNCHNLGAERHFTLIYQDIGNVGVVFDNQHSQRSTAVT
jgi:hypothetical protein